MNAPKTFFLTLIFLPISQLLASTKDLDFFDRTLRFFSFNDYSVRVVVLGVIFIGIGCGLMGGLVVTRRLSLFSDTLSHAVLPGIVVGFILGGFKSSFVVIIGAMVAGFLGVTLISSITKYTKIRLDSALGLVLSGFYAVGVCLLTRIQKLEFGNQSGIDRYIFGQIAGISSTDLYTIVISGFLILAIIILFYKELLVTGFDSNFAHSIGLPVEFIQYIFWMLLAFTVITSLQIVGVILVSALLIIPAATASIITQNMKTLLIWSSLFAVISGIIGTYLSFLGNSLPTGPIIVLCSCSIFIIILFLHWKNGLLVKWYRLRGKEKKIAVENTLKAVYQELEVQSFSKDLILISDLAKRRRVSVPEVCQEIIPLIEQELAFVKESSNPKLRGENKLALSPKGWSEACRIIRNHRLWELYLTNEVQYQADHVHDDAEKIEHILGDELVRKLEKILSNPTKDPHGKLIPSQQDIKRGYMHIQ